MYSVLILDTDALSLALVANVINKDGILTHIFFGNTKLNKIDKMDYGTSQQNMNHTNKKI